MTHLATSHKIGWLDDIVRRARTMHSRVTMKHSSSSGLCIQALHMNAICTCSAIVILQDATPLVSSMDILPGTGTVQYYQS